ncbi:MULTISPECIES: histidine phosphatase family protein [unclassified Rhodococcus (in: high G+C Gram-positive bacteria)]|uniref:histidine phosphatase family protein n=1 Tax=unclassified Rhodococcus (in: high G+C Gram-positive bacteria) TaxID=192944 RepID=UPI0037C6DD8F
MNRRCSILATVSTAVVSLTACTGTPTASAPTSAQPTRGDAEPITITLMRHAESAGNASGLIDTSTPGPDITDKGRQEARAAADRFAGQDFDGVYASTMVRTQETAEFMARAVDEPVEVLPGYGKSRRDSTKVNRRPRRRARTWRRPSAGSRGSVTSVSPAPSTATNSLTSSRP